MFLARTSERLFSQPVRRYASRPNRARNPKSGTFPTLQTKSTGKKSRVPLYLGGFVLYGVSIYMGSSLYHVYNNTEPKSLNSTDSRETLADSNPEVYDRIASSYDSDIGLDEILMGLTWLRWSLIRHLKGDIMEVSSGTGRNMSYYRPENVRSLTFVDRSSEMQDVARSKWKTLLRRESRWNEKEVRFIDVAVEGLSPTRQQYDTVVQSFGLCSVSDPVGYLSHLSQFCQHDGQIVLLEHGRSRYSWINRILDNTVHRHAEKWGCFYNRDITRIVEECQDVEVIRCQRWHFGTTYVYYLRPKQV